MGQNEYASITAEGTVEGRAEERGIEYPYIDL